MGIENDRTTILVRLLDRMRDGDPGAKGELVQVFQVRLEHLARKMLLQFLSVGRWVEAEDVLQASLMRLLRALESVQPISTRDYFGLAAEQIRREPLDLKRRFQGRRGLSSNHSSLGTGRVEGSSKIDQPIPDDEADDLERWCRFHEEVTKLPSRDREVVELIYYHGWSRVSVAALFDVDERTVRRWWDSALVDLHRVLSEEAGDPCRH